MVLITEWILKTDATSWGESPSFLKIKFLSRGRLILQKRWWMDSPHELNAVFHSVEKNMNKQLPHCCGSPITKRNDKWAVSFLWISHCNLLLLLKKKKDFHLVPATTNFVSLLFLKWSTDHWENLQFNSHHQSHHNIWPLLALFEFSSKINYMYVTLPILQFLPLVISAVFMAQSLGKY